MSERVLFIFALAVLCALCYAKTGYFFHISDTHVQSDYKEGSNTKKGCYAGTGSAGKFGDYRCRPPYEVEQTAMLSMPKFVPEECPTELPLFVLWTGDSVAKRDGKYSKEGIEYNLRNITEMFDILYKRYNGKVPIYPVIGNHDTYPQHQLPGKEYWLYDFVADLWEPFLPKSALTTIKKSGYYTVDVNSELRLIVLNTVLYYHPNTMTNSSDKDPGGQIAWLKETLADAKKNNQAVYIAGHVPIRGYGGSFRYSYVSEFLEAMKPYQSIIKGSFWGHNHVDTFQLIGENTKEAHVGHLASSISPGNGKNPSFRRYIFDTSKQYELTRWRTFYMDLPKSNEVGKITWKTLFDSKTDYGLKDLTPASIVNFAKRLADDDSLFQKMWNHRTADGHIKNCDSKCKRDFLCSVVHTLHDDYEKCING